LLAKGGSRGREAETSRYARRGRNWKGGGWSRPDREWVPGR